MAAAATTERPQSLGISHAWRIALALLLLELVQLAASVSIQSHLMDDQRGMDFRSSYADYMNSEQQDGSGGSECSGRPHQPQYPDCPVRRCSGSQDCGYPQMRCACDRELCGSVCVPVGSSCPALAEPANGRRSREFPEINEFEIGQSLAYSCDREFALEGEVEKIACQANGRWSHAAPRCTREEKCGPPRRIPNTVLQPTPNPDVREYRSGDEFLYTCAPGYRSDKPGLSVTAICTRGHWNMHDIVCSIISCGHPGNLANGRHLNRNYTFTQKVSYFCNEGYTMECTGQTEAARSAGCQVRTCGPDGRWSGSMPVCKPILCPTLENPPNGEVTRGWNTVNSVVQYRCHVGYRIEGAGSRMCRRDGHWDGSEPRCVVQDCGPPPFVANAYRVLPGATKYKARVTYTCLPDAKLEGENGGQIVCQKDGQWVPAPPKCRSHCAAPVVDRGRALIGRPDGPPAVGKVPSDTTLWIRCEDNYQLRKTLFPRCDNGTWTRIPTCVPKDCNDRPPLVKNGIARFYETKHDARVTYSCYVGYEVVRGSTLLTCRFGKWVGTPPTCTKKKCPWIQSPQGVEKWLIGPDGIKNQWTRPQTTSDNEELVQFQCIGKGQVLRGHTHAICINGEWRPPGSPECVAQMHKQIPHDWLFYRVGRK